MKRDILVILICILMSHWTFAQRPHLEIGGTLGFKDEFHYKPEFDVNAKFTEFHIYDLNLLTRISKRRLGGELSLGFEKAANYFIRNLDNTTETNYMNLNRVSVDISPFFYLKKESKLKWDVQGGLRNYFNLNRFIQVPNNQDLKTWKLAARVQTNVIYKNLLVGIYYEHTLRSDYYFKSNHPTFGMRLGVIY